MVEYLIKVKQLISAVDNYTKEYLLHPVIYKEKYAHDNFLLCEQI